MHPRKSDLMEFIRHIVGCSYISDLRMEPYNSKARLLMGSIDLDGYGLRELSNVANYLYDADAAFRSVFEAKAFFGGERHYERIRAFPLVRMYAFPRQSTPIRVDGQLRN